MSTFKAWLIANLEYVFLAACLLWAGIAALLFGDRAFLLMDGVTGEGVPGWALLVLLVLFGMEDVPDLITRVLGFLLFLAAGVVAIALQGSLAAWIVPLLLACIVVAVIVARACAQNFGEVVSRRTLYRNSKADIFDIKWKYVLDRFCYSFKACLFFAAFVALTIPGLVEKMLS